MDSLNGFIESEHQLVDMLCPTVTDRSHHLELTLMHKVAFDTTGAYYIGVRGEISAPFIWLKDVQKQILKKILYRFEPSKYAKSYVKNGGTCDTALPHSGKKVLKLVFKDFYEHCSYRMVHEFVFTDDIFGNKVANLLTGLCTYKSRLHPGSPTSPAISNLVLKPFDDAIGEYCEDRNISYTRYGSNMFFSGECDFKGLKEIIYRCLNDIYGSFNFELDDKPVARGMRQKVTGIVVTETLKVPSSYRRKIRQEIYYCKKYGVRDHILNAGLNKYILFDGINARVYPKLYLRRLMNRITYVLNVNPDDSEMKRYIKEVKALLLATELWRGKSIQGRYNISERRS